MDFHIPPLLVILAAAVAAPLIGEFIRRVGLPIVVLELVLGVTIGPQVLGWAVAEGAVPAVASLGMVFLFFLAGLEIELPAVRGRPINLASVGWVACIAASLAVAYAGHKLGVFDAWIVVGIALSTTALGVLMPMLRDSGMLETPFGRQIMAVGVVGELGPILLMSLLLSRQTSTGLQSVLVLAFFGTVLVVAWALLKGVAAPPVLRLIRRTMTTSSQLPVRVAMLVLGALVVMAEHYGLDFALGALAAGMIIKLALHSEFDDLMRQKFDAIGFGFLVPIFFITSGIKLDVLAVFGSGTGILMTIALVAALFLARLPVMILGHRSCSARESIALGLYGATTLSLIVVMTDLAVKNGTMSSREGGPLVVAGMLSVIVFPIVASALLGRRHAARVGPYHDHDSL